MDDLQHCLCPWVSMCNMSQKKRPRLRARNDAAAQILFESQPEGGTRELFEDHTIAPTLLSRVAILKRRSNKQAHNIGPGTWLPVPDLIFCFFTLEQFFIPFPDFPVTQVILQNIIGWSAGGGQVDWLENRVG